MAVRKLTFATSVPLEKYMYAETQKPVGSRVKSEPSEDCQIDVDALDLVAEATTRCNVIVNLS